MNPSLRHNHACSMWDVFNEPRCPGCLSASQQASHLAWLQEMGAHLHSQAPRQLVAAGTEGEMRCVDGWVCHFCSLLFLHTFYCNLNMIRLDRLLCKHIAGYFMDAANIGWNPGAGASCEGEDW